MSDKPLIDSPLLGKTVALPESRQLDVLADLFERRGALVMRAPLVAILDSPNRDAVESWLSDFLTETPDFLIILTGEGLRRLCGFAERSVGLAKFVKALEKTVKICRGPKPGRALKEIGLQPDLMGKEPTTAGIIAALAELDLQEKRVAVQLYGEDPNLLLQNYLSGRGVRYNTVAPYVYAPQTDTSRVLELIDQLTSDKVDIIAFTSQPQLHRLMSVAREHQRDGQLIAALQRTQVAAIGPVVAEQLQQHGIPVAVMPEDSFFMKPLVTEIEKLLNRMPVPQR